jgi:hypothetical protein
MKKQQKILIAWWGSFSGGGTTVSDWMSLENVIKIVKIVKQCGLSADIAAIEEYKIKL